MFSQLFTTWSNELREVVSARRQNKTPQILSAPHPPDPETRVQQHVEQFPLWETSEEAPARQESEKSATSKPAGKFMTLTHHSPSLWVQCSAVGRKLTAPVFLAGREIENWTIHMEYFDFSQGILKGLAYVLLEWKCWKENTKLGSAESNPRFRLSCTHSPMPLLFASVEWTGEVFS